MPRISTGDSASTYKSADDTLKLRISHQKAKTRIRRMARVDQTTVAEDPLTAESSYQSLGVYLVVDEPEFGFSDTEVEYVIQGLIDLLSPAIIAKLLGSET